MSVIGSAYRYENQLSSQWELQVFSLDSFDGFKFKIQDVECPFIKLNVERKYSGETFFKNVEEVSEITITIRESPNFETFKFFKQWQDYFYDSEKRVYKVYNDLAQYYRKLYDFSIVFYRSDPIAVPVPYLDIDTSYPSMSFFAYGCKPIAINTLSLDYSGGPLLYSITFMPELIAPYEY